MEAGQGGEDHDADQEREAEGAPPRGASHSVTLRSSALRRFWIWLNQRYITNAMMAAAMSARNAASWTPPPAEPAGGEKTVEGTVPFSQK